MRHTWILVSIVFPLQFLPFAVVVMIPRNSGTVNFHSNIAVASSSSSSASAAASSSSSSSSPSSSSSLSSSSSSSSGSSSISISSSKYRSVQHVSSPCPKDWLYYKRHCYGAFIQQNESLQWFEAEARCNMAGRGRDGHLVSILDVWEMKQVHSWLVNEWKAPKFDAIYIGLIDAAKEGVYRWSDNNPMSYTDWAPASKELNSAAQPDGGAFEDCTVIILDRYDTTANWHDVPCTLGKHGHQRNALASKLYLNESFYQFIDSIDSYICKMDALLLKKTSVTVPQLSSNASGKNSFESKTNTIHLVPGPLYNDLLDSAIDGNMTSVIRSPVERQYTCKNLEVISIVFRCDGVPNCRDGSDEEECPIGSCLPSQFQCANARCIAISAYCDFVDDCGDGSDERFCERRVCKPGPDYKCLNGQCIPATKRCDLLPDCRDGSDEIHCTSGSFCNPNTTFQCYYGNCIPIYAVCDRHRDCPGKFFEDEQPGRCDNRFSKGVTLRDQEQSNGMSGASSSSLTSFGSSSNSGASGTALMTVDTYSFNQSSKHLFECQSGQLVETSKRCIYDFDQYGYQIGCRDVTHLRNCESFDCPDPYYVKCPESYCIPPRFICDGKWDCIGGADEKGCAKYYCSGHYKCANSSACTLLSHLCDGIRHCPLGDDEWFCDVTCPKGCTCIGLYASCQSMNLTKLPEGLSRKIKKLDFSQNLLGNELFRDYLSVDSGFANFEDLGELILQSNNITILPARKFIRLKNLYKLDLRFNRIHTIRSAAFAGLRRVTQLYLDHNHDLSVIEPEAFLGLTALLQLNLSHTRIHKLSENSFRGLMKLQSLNLTHNGLTTILPHAFRGLDALDSIDLRGNSIQDFPGDIFNGLKQLHHLSTDSFKFCCLASSQIPFDRCLPPADEISDCEDLMSSPVQRSFLWILGLAALICNFTVVAKRFRMTHQASRLSENVSSSFIISLGCADFLMGIYLIIIASVDVYYRGHYITYSDSWRYSYLCKFCGFLSTLSTEASVFTLVFITLDRLICICYQMSIPRFSMKTAHRLIAVSWIIAFIMSFLPLVVTPYFRDEFYARSGVCLALHLTNNHPAGWEYSVGVFLFTNLMAFLIIFLAYCLMYNKVRSVRRQTRTITRQIREINTGKKMAMIVMSNFVCWFPVIIMGIIAMSGVLTLPPAVYSWTAVFVLPFNSALNPILYTFAHYSLSDLFRLNPQATRKDSITGQTIKLRHINSNSSSGVQYRASDSKKSKNVPIKPPPGYMSLYDFLHKNRPLQPRQMVQISYFLSETMKDTHATGFVLGGITVKNVFVSTAIDSNYIRVYVPENQSYKVPMSRDCNDYAEDIEDLGRIIQSMLRAYSSQNRPPPSFDFNDRGKTNEVKSTASQKETRRNNCYYNPSHFS